MSDSFTFDIEQLDQAITASIHTMPRELTFEEFVEWADKIYHDEKYVKESSGNTKDVQQDLCVLSSARDKA